MYGTYADTPIDLPTPACPHALVLAHNLTLDAMSMQAAQDHIGTQRHPECYRSPNAFPPAFLDRYCIGALGRLTGLRSLSLDCALDPVYGTGLNGLSSLTALTHLQIKHHWAVAWHNNWPVSLLFHHTYIGRDIPFVYT